MVSTNITSTPVAPATGGAPGWRSIDWQLQTRTAQLGPDRVSYVEFGAGQSTALLIHGLGGNWTVWLESLPALAAGHRVIALDLPGFGASPAPADPISIPGYAATAERLLDHLGVAHAAVIGSSLGGWVAADLAMQAPERVSRLVLVDAAGILPTPRERRKALSVMEMAAVMAPLAPRFRRAVASRRRLRAMALRYTTAHPGDLAADLVFTALPTAPDPGFRPALRACKRSWSTEWCEQLEGITCATLVVWGELDSLLPVRHGHEYARRIPGSQLVILPEAGHLPMLERPEQFNSRVLDFLAQTALAGHGGTEPSFATDNLG